MLLDLEAEEMTKKWHDHHGSVDNEHHELVKLASTGLKHRNAS